MAAPTPAPGFFARLAAIGDRPSDTRDQRLRHALLIYMGVLMSGGGVLWGSIALSQDLPLPSAVPYGYVVITAVNLAYFRASKNFDTVRFVQVLISLLLPFLFQWSLGGFGASGAVMLWAMLAMVGSLTFSGSREAWRWLALFVGLTILSGFLDETVRARFSPDPSEGIRTMFFVINIVFICSVVFGLTIYILFERERVGQALEDANRRVTELNEHLEEQVASRTRELDSALSQSRAIVRNLPDGLLAVDSDNVVRTANPALGALLQTSADVLIGLPAIDVTPLPLARLAERAIERNEVDRLELALADQRVGAAIASPIHSGERDGEVVGAVVILRDVTLEREVDRMKTDFIATVSHELRTPLTSVLGFARLTGNKLEANVFPHVPKDDRRGQRALSQARGNLEIMVSEARRLTDLINDVLDISKMEAGRMEWDMRPLAPADLVRRAAEATQGLFTEEGVRFESVVEPGLDRIRGDEARLLQVLINLISNAAKFTDQGSVTLGARRAGDSLELYVEDTGDGIDESNQSAIFKKFKQVGDTLTDKPQGTGLGLPICKQIVHAHDGAIEVESHFGKGSCFTVRLPLAGAESPMSRTSDFIPRAQLADKIGRKIARVPDLGRDILVVDDDASLREMLRQQLGERGYRVRLAADGYEALEAVRSRRPDVVVLDVAMPQLSGFDVAAALKSDPQTRSIPIIILSVVEDPARGYNVGVDEYLQKPSDAATLVASVQRLLASAKGSRKVLVVQNSLPVPEELTEELAAAGYQVVGGCMPGDALERAREARPDLLLVDRGADEGPELLRAIRADRDLAHVVVVQLLDPDRGSVNPNPPSP